MIQRPKRGDRIMRHRDTTVRSIPLLLGLLLLWVPSPSTAQNILQDTLRDFRVGESWIYDDWDAARKLAARERKPIFAVFRCVP